MADVTADMNDRERKRFAGALRQLAGAATKAAEGLERRDDEEFFVGYMTFRIGSMAMKEIDEVLLSSLKRDAAPEFPPIIGG